MVTPDASARVPSLEILRTSAVLKPRQNPGPSPTVIQIRPDDEIQSAILQRRAQERLAFLATDVISGWVEVHDLSQM